MFGAKKRTAGSRPDKVYKDVCSAFDSKDIKYNRDEEKFMVYSTFKGDDLPIKLTISVNEEMPILCFDALLDFQAPAGSYSAIMGGLNEINSTLHFGAFVLDPESGRVIYRYHHMFAEYLPSKDVILSITKMVVDIVDANDGNLKKLIPEHTSFKDPMFN